MRPKEHPELIFDVIPKLYEQHFKVFVTHLGNMQEQLLVLPRKFCRMYTTRPLANQLLKYLRSRQAKIEEADFEVVEECQPFSLRLSDGKRLEAMLCPGSKLGHNLILLIRRPTNVGKLLYCYSAVKLESLGCLLANSIFNSWIAQGTEQLYLNLSSVNVPFEPVDFDELAANIEEYRKSHNAVVLLELPLFGYEELVWQLNYTKLHGHIRLLGDFQESFECLNSELKLVPGRLTKVHVSAIQNSSAEDSQAEEDEKVATVHFPLGIIKWSPLPTRMHLRQLCSLLRPDHIQGIVPFHAVGNVPPAPEFLQCFRSKYFVGSKEKEPSSKEIQTKPTKEKEKQKAPLRIIGTAKRFAFVDDENDSD
ncbi:uncharacterized protein [Drosophila kikkawai]|uniref:Uncharacterized protein n=1 Tax=Drosophila kikkawai TaxID=30033 RepID=A0A6P4IPQ7_DROKI|nr:uncharacterized protein LOC108080644 [Drosophila kikkawai]